MSLAVRMRNKRKPDGWELVEGPLLQFEERLREAVNDPHEGKRKAEATWPIHRIHYERNRFIYDLYYKQQKVSRELYDFLVREKIVDAALISKWRKPGYEILCSMTAIDKANTNFNTTSICRVPLAQRGGQIMPSNTTGCVSCASGDGIDGGPCWWTDPYTAWAAKKRQDKKQQRKQERAETLDPEIEARLKSLRGGGGDGSVHDSGVVSDADVDARLRALRGEASSNVDLEPDEPEDEEEEEDVAGS
tara:strand:- start:233 stop:976 length:744 start_codon:yes stop_codon:yes gene_type:complete